MKGKFKTEIASYFKNLSYKKEEKYVNSLDEKTRSKQEKISIL